MKIQREFYEKYHSELKITKTGEMKQSARLRVLRDLFREGINEFRNILIVGCGSDKDIYLIEDKGIIALDLSLTAIKLAKLKVPQNKYLVADGHVLPFKDQSFDLIVCSEVIEHVQHPNRMLSEIYRVMYNQGTLIITAPNWYSLYGLARKLGEFITKQPITSANQPIDNWYTPEKLERQLIRYFKIGETRGVWYFPPIGRGKWVVPAFIAYPIFRFLLPIDRIMGKIFPYYGHIIVIKCIKS